jgi:hypothetical protein
MQIQEELNEEKEDSSGSGASNGVNKKGERDEEDLQIEPIDSEEKLFKNINLSNGKPKVAPRTNDNQQSYAGRRRLNKRDLGRVTTVLELPSGSEFGKSS